MPTSASNAPLNIFFTPFHAFFQFPVNTPEINSIIPLNAVVTPCTTSIVDFSHPEYLATTNDKTIVNAFLNAPERNVATGLNPLIIFPAPFPIVPNAELAVLAMLFTVYPSFFVSTPAAFNAVTAVFCIFFAAAVILFQFL